MQGGMLMPEVFYHADTDSVTVDLSHHRNRAAHSPAGQPSPGQLQPGRPWFDCLDPSRQGLAFSRRYGFDIATGSNDLPLNRQLWIRKLSGSPDLGIYDYRPNSTPKRWTPIFGTAGSATRPPWSGNMWHVGVTAPPGTNTYTATFEVYVVNTDTGLEVPGSSLRTLCPGLDRRPRWPAPAQHHRSASRPGPARLARHRHQLDPRLRLHPQPLLLVRRHQPARHPRRTSEP